MVKALGTKDFMEDIPRGDGGDILDWKEDGKATIFFHPAGFTPRRSVWFPVLTQVETKKKVGKGEVKTEMEQTLVVLPEEEKCPLSEFIQFLRDQTGIEDDEIVLEFDEGAYQISKGDALGLRDYSWKKSVRPTKEHMVPVVDVNNVEAGLQILICRPALSKSIKKLITNQMEEQGDQKGDPLQNPYAIKITYDKDETPQMMYGAFYSTVPMTEGIQALLDSPAPDLSGLITPASPREVWELFKDALRVEFTPTTIGEEEAQVEETEAPAPIQKKPLKKIAAPSKETEEVAEETPVPPVVKKPLKKIATPPAPAPEPEEEALVPAPAKKPLKKIAAPPPPPAEDLEPCPACSTMIPSSAKKCPNPECGVEFETEAEIDSGENEPEPVKEAPKPAASPAPKGKTVTCGECKKTYPVGTKRCSSCGEKL